MTLFLAWLVCNALVAALLLSQARVLVLLGGWMLILALYAICAGAAWMVLTPVLTIGALLRRLGLMEAA